MILNRTGAEFEYEGVTYTIGGAIEMCIRDRYWGHWLCCCLFAGFGRFSYW